MLQARLVDPPHYGRNKRLRLPGQLRFVDELIGKGRYMTNTDFSLAPKVASSQTSTPRFGAHQITDRPASAARKRVGTMSTTGQTRGTSNDTHQHGAPARSIGAIVYDPLRWGLATKPRRYTLAGVTMVALVTLIL
jgi:hypothetical protein